MMNLTIIILFLLCSILSIKNDLLFFQQNSYKLKVHTKWIFKHPKRYFLRFVLLFTPLLITFNVLNKNFIILFFIIAFFNILDIKKHIKPLVWTSRAKRLLVTSIIFILIISLISLRIEIVNTFLLSIYSIMPFILLLANIIIMPIEKFIRFKYISDAKKILKQHNDLIVIGITGSYGKTSVKNYLRTILSEKYNVLMTPKNYNTTMGVVKTIRENLKSTHQIFICEMGATYKGDIEEICKIVNPKIGILTGIAPIHLETFKTIDTLIQTKLELSKFAEKTYYNADNDALKKVAQSNFIPYSLLDYNDIKVTTTGTGFGEYKTSLVGLSNIQNLIGAISVAKNEFSLSNDEIKNGLLNIRQVEHRQEIKILNSKNILIDDAYNSNPIGAFAALKTLSLFENYYKILITPGMIDLGKKQYEENYKFGAEAGKFCDLIVLVGQKWTKPIIDSFSENIFNNYKIFNTTNDAILYAKSLNLKQKNKIILIENDLPDNYQ